ncbi:hypothetical protein [Acaryochloris sp. IP29b_bin.137]|uniref:hypothetical protein n=1 Tax=Acaryochloris sp. IP29b_bin.137 TaxID=2969217 RepID=UPI0026358B5E|nr:hypothetical protein [Acaryochloris sp. IP29b_bin.137]
MLGEILNSVYMAIILDIFGGAALALGASAGLIYVSLLAEATSERFFGVIGWLLIGLSQVLLVMVGIYAGWVAALSFWFGFGFLAVLPFLRRFGCWVSSGSSTTHMCAFVSMTITSSLFLSYQLGYYSALTSTR